MTRTLSSGVAFVSLLLSAAATAADEQGAFLMTTITEIGRPYTVINGGCVYGKATGFDVMSPEFESAFQAAAAKLSAVAKANGGDAVVGMQASPISEAAGDRNGVLLCGTIVKLKK